MCSCCKSCSCSSSALLGPLLFGAILGIAFHLLPTTAKAEISKELSKLIEEKRAKLEEAKQQLETATEYIN
jgi:hypothetical protein